jgi:hydroxypyruvate isomerase
MRRRKFFSATTAAACLALPDGWCAEAKAAEPFTLKYAPHFGMFQKSAGEDLLAQLRFAADHGFRAWEDNPMMDRDVETQLKIAKEMERLQMEMGVISALKGIWKQVNFAGDGAALRDNVLARMKAVVQVAKRVNATCLTVVCGLSDPKLPLGYQTANCIDLLNRCCDIIEPHGLTMVLEPLNTKSNHPGVFLSESPHAYLICKAVHRPSCKVLFDIYHQQITEGNLIPNIDRCWDWIGYFQCADNPGRKEPGTGEINYENVFRHLSDRGYHGIVGMEPGNASKTVAGEQAVIDAYRAVDPPSPSID